MIHQPIETQVIIAATIGGMVILNAAILWFMPRLTRPDLYFAVTVLPGFPNEPDGKSILSRYRKELVLVSLVALIVFVAGIALLGIRFGPAGPVIQTAAGFIAFYRARSRVLPHAVQPTMIREAELQPHTRIIPGGWIATSGPFILLALCAGYLWIHGSTPARGIIYSLTMTVSLIGLTVLLYGLAHWVRPVYTGGPERARELQFRRTVAAVILGAEYYITIQSSWLLLVPPHQGLISLGLFPLALIFTLVVILVLARLGQGGSRLASAQKSSRVSDPPVGDRTADRYWKLGVFYFNPDDSAIFVEKRFGLGYSLNFARPTTWGIMALLLIAPLVAVLARLTQFLPTGV
jgi:hypothetical protein